MNSLNFLRIACVALVGIGLSACPPVTSKTPVGTTVKALRDPALTGMWRGRAGGDVVSTFTFLPQDDGTFTVVLVTPPSGKDKGGYGVFSVQTVALGRYHFMNTRETFEDNKPATGTMADNTIPMLYRFTDDALVLYLVDETAAKNAIKAGKLQGTVESGEFGDVTITAAPGELDAFMASPAGRALFTRPLAILRKMK
ncbi:MAG TPA: hypothetical protein VMD53_19540 [Rhizomicrobium sp.]|nr:hypothetical protein [Rhizomicrobium sp.]